jgi:hypothetical protein
MPNTREKLIELLESAFESFIDDPYCIPDEREFADHLISNGVTFAEDNNVPSKWIPVTERLPEGECLAVSMLTGPAYKEMLIGYVGEASNWDTGYECESDGEILPNVTHWMPLPEAPKGE